ncbi:SWF or SNF family helicase, partial [Streptomyces sp. JAC128]
VGDATGLAPLAADRAMRAYAMRAEAMAVGHDRRPPAAGLTPEQDAVRLTAGGRPDPRLTARLAAGAGRAPAGPGIALR